MNILLSVLNYGCFLSAPFLYPNQTKLFSLSNFDHQMEEKLMYELMGYYPMNNKESVWLNTVRK